jgi:hypothetical protein
LGEDSPRGGPAAELPTATRSGSAQRPPSQRRTRRRLANGRTERAAARGGETRHRGPKRRAAVELQRPTPPRGRTRPPPLRCIASPPPAAALRPPCHQLGPSRMTTRRWEQIGHSEIRSTQNGRTRRGRMAHRPTFAATTAFPAVAKRRATTSHSPSQPPPRGRHPPLEKLLQGKGCSSSGRQG